MARVPTRAERQQQTRDALVLAAREVFSRDGFHAARLDDIAREAGFSKGAVYSNFDGKAELFLAVMDLNLTAAVGEPWDPFAPRQPVTAEEMAALGLPDVSPAELETAMRGFALATLEFIAAAARDEKLTAELGRRSSVLLDLYGGSADLAQDPADPLPREQVAALLTALDQGAALLSLAGLAPIDQRLLQDGLRRLVNPWRAADEPAEGGPGGSALHTDETQRRIARSAVCGKTHPT